MLEIFIALSSDMYWMPRVDIRTFLQPLAIPLCAKSSLSMFSLQILSAAVSPTFFLISQKLGSRYFFHDTLFLLVTLLTVRCFFITGFTVSFLSITL